MKWTKITQAGDREELGKYGEGKSDLWERINARAERCSGFQCPSFHNCYLTKLRNQILKADLVIANHALLLANQRLQNSDFGNILPDAPVLILDEAHELEEQLTESCAEQWSSRDMSILISDINNKLASEFDIPLTSWQNAWDDIISLLPQCNGIFKLTSNGTLSTSLQKVFDIWLSIGKTKYEELKKLKPSKTNSNDLIYQKLIDRINLALSSMELIFTQPQGWVSTVSIDGLHNAAFKTNPIDIKPFFHEYLRRRFKTVILTSATLRDGYGFNGLKLRLGFKDDEVECSQSVESPFDFKRQGLLFVPPNIPARNSGRDSVGDVSWINACQSTMERLITVSKGRTLILFTSRKMLAAFRPRLETSLPGVTFFVQGEAMARSTMIKRFKKTPNAVLLGLSSFWQGIDMPGKVLSLVIITALPFLPPDDPILQSRIQEADAIQKGLGFTGIQVPQMIIKLKQGIGRLIRTSSDRGVICILDPRIMLPHEDPNGKYYAAQTRAALPEFPLSRNWDEVESFLQSI
jgi:ATP-dependent DNA helicase DinG